MNKLMAGLLVLAIGTANAAFVPASETKQNQATQLMDIRERVAQQIASRTAAGYHFVAVDMDGASWKVENQIMKELQDAGYDVSYTRDHKVYGWNSLNGALLVRWVK